MTTGADVTSVDAHLQDLAVRLADAEISGYLDLTAATAWAVLTELNEQTWSRIDAQRALAQAVVAAQAAVADGRDGSPDPLVHVRRFLAKQGLLPPEGVSSLAILAWQGPPPRGLGPRLACPRRPGRLAALGRRLRITGCGR